MDFLMIVSLIIIEGAAKLSDRMLEQIIFDEQHPSPYKFSNYICANSIGVWRSWLAHQHGVLGAGGSSPLTPTKNPVTPLPDF